MSLSSFPFNGIWVALVTPFAPDGLVDHAAVRRLVRHYAEAGVHGLAVAATTGEATSLDEAEYRALLDAVLEAAGTLPVIAGLPGMHQPTMIATLQDMARLPLAGWLVTAPLYVRPSQAGIEAHFKCLADIARQPVVLYDIPYRTGVSIELPTLLRLAGHLNIQAIKDCGGSVDKTQALIADGRLAVLSGEDNRIFQTLCMGGQGAISASAHLRPDLFIAMAQAINNGDLSLARKVYHRLAPLIQALFVEPNPAPLKAALAADGLINETLRAPLIRASHDTARALRQILASLPHPGSALAPGPRALKA